MPCNDNNSVCNEGATGVFDSSAVPSSSSSTTLLDERLVSITTENGHAFPQSSSAEQKNTIVRTRTASSRSTSNLHSMCFLPGEDVDSDNFVDMESCQLYVTQFRIIIIAHNQSAICAIPLTGVDLLEAKDIVGLQISSKDGKIIKLRAENSETACAWYKKLMQKTCVVRDLDTIFAFAFFNQASKKLPNWLRKETKRISAFEHLHNEFKRLKLSDDFWRISVKNETFEICPTYPQFLIVPKSVSDEDLKQMSYGRCYRRFPTVVWRNKRNGAVLLRSSQPSIGFFGLTNEKDISHYERIRAAISPDSNKKFLIVDARSYTAAWANRAKGGGFEGPDTYPNADVIFMGLANIHNIRYSFHQLRQTLNGALDPNIFLQNLQSTLWLHNICQLFNSVERCLKSLCNEGTSVLVHCSDGWDRTTQIVSLCMLIADPHYRTFEGFEFLIRWQWVEFGHKFSDRCGVLNADDNEKCPVFLQFLDCVYQLWEKNTDQFEFNRRYLMKLAQHTFSGLFGTFLFNSLKDAIKNGCDPNDPDEHRHRCFQVWSYLGKHNTEFRNPAFREDYAGGMLRYPKTLPELLIWRDAYCCTADQSLINNPNEPSHQNTGTGSTQDISSDKANSGLSRSQSAASLTSLVEQSMNLSTPIPSPGPSIGFGISCGSPCIGHSTSKIHDNCTMGSFSAIFCQKCLDVDGLSRVPSQFEDKVLRRIYDLEKQLGKLNPSSNSSNNINSQQNISAMREPFINGKYSNENSNSRRMRNESLESFEVLPECCRLKHHSSSSLTSVIQPSSVSSNSTTISDYAPSGNNLCKNGTLSETNEINYSTEHLEVLPPSSE
ncbi:hypothetical protein ACQ4LE_002056 [Meloidogyne hapla]